MDKDQIMEIIRKRETRLDEWLQNSEKSMSKLKKARKESLKVKLKGKKVSGGSS